jgi:hypothetical protein
MAYQKKAATLSTAAERHDAESEYVLSSVQRGDAERENDHLFFASYAVATVATDDKGEFKVTLPAGQYTMFAVMPLYERTYEWFVGVRVREGQAQRIQLDGTNNYTRGWACETPLPFPATSARPQ